MSIVLDESKAAIFFTASYVQPLQNASSKRRTERLFDHRVSYWVLADDVDAACGLQAERLHILGVLRDLDAFEHYCYSCIHDDDVAVGVT
ncbi:hypothetical protein HBI56_241230 [Parastagonospora nodorum]|uniref:Uncharacterized protein n=2 Tax=Phaeosphaeria nodorum (strain SN15 / ATCC MYA-4574 / FGSC 10173) TaxID=321614 RepID=Q0TVE3_PHANO|nr:hypothetical protein SNOG_16521 [Parastagonospora nodorum SN15]KAH3903850.1 hypothetical protein HBH56_243430 [Parastagonospora nodorum]EAT76126.2 hypothetical protein SNOG_16521 [Parastagonospora nodorum SN15]KAH3924027.1 hypothetical protein HBH54_198870 [Parastagonospora nodorum]KAH3944573.1 hypothetical protein HBH53_155380 [Parastagonospora nodorum]KAH3956112.1 hypothetical protein HBH51_254370 [Parastagonospora nodorum]